MSPASCGEQTTSVRSSLCQIQPVSPLAPHRRPAVRHPESIVDDGAPAAVQRGRAQLALCVPGSPVQIGALSVSLAAWSPLRRHLVQRKGFSAWGGSLLRRVRLPHPSGESFDLRKLRPNDSPPVAVAAGLRSSQGGLAACRLGPLLPSENHSTCAGSGRMILLRSFLRPGLRRLALFRSALRAPVICSPSSCVGQESRLLPPASLCSNPFGGFSFLGRFAPASQRVAAFRPPLRLNLICPSQAPNKSDSASASAVSCYRQSRQGNSVMGSVWIK